MNSHHDHHANVPLAQRMRPKHLHEVIGQTHLLATNAPITRMTEQGYLSSMILHGEAGIGKTTIAMLLAQAVNRPFHALSAISAGVKQVKELLQATTNTGFGLNFAPPVVFIDEIHRFNKAQQDALLSAVETGQITLIGATTENPSFSVNNAILSRCQVYRLEPLNHEQLQQLLHRALTTDSELKQLEVRFHPEDSINSIIELANGDARKALNILELVIQTAKPQPLDNQLELNHHNTTTKLMVEITEDLIAQVVQTTVTRYDKNGDNHYDMVSAMIKSIRGSDPDASLYWMARMLVNGEDPAFIGRRLVIVASEDIGNANPNALLLADTALRSVQAIGMPEARIILGQVVVYLATCAKSNTTYKAINQAMKLAENDNSPVPLHLRNGVTSLMKAQGDGKGYIYPHDYPNHYHPQTYLPEHLLGTQFYQYGDNKREQHSKQFMQWLKNMTAINDE